MRIKLKRAALFSSRIFLLCVILPCVFVLLCGCFNYSFSYIYRQGDKALYEKENAVKQLKFLNEEETKGYVYALRKETLRLGKAKNKAEAEKLLDGYVISLNQIFLQAQETDEHKMTLKSECGNIILSTTEAINKLGGLTVMEKNIFADALIFDDYSALSLKRLDEYKNKLTVIAEKADKLALKLDKMRNDSIQRREGLSKEYSDMLDDFLHNSMFTDQICGIDKIENKVNVVEEEYVSLIAYIDFMTQIKTDLC